MEVISPAFRLRRAGNGGIDDEEVVSFEPAMRDAVEPNYLGEIVQPSFSDASSPPDALQVLL